MPNESFTTSLHSVNSPVFIKKYDKRVNCLLSRSCYHCLVGAITGPHPIHTRECVRICASVLVLVLAHRGCLLLTHMNVQAMRVTFSLLKLICQVTCDRYCTCKTGTIPFARKVLGRKHSQIGRKGAFR